jgi:hypothetical protein
VVVVVVAGKKLATAAKTVAMVVEETEVAAAILLLLGQGTIDGCVDVADGWAWLGPWFSCKPLKSAFEYEN